MEQQDKFSRRTEILRYIPTTNAAETNVQIERAALENKRAAPDPPSRKVASVFAPDFDDAMGIRMVWKPWEFHADDEQPAFWRDLLKKKGSLLNFNVYEMQGYWERIVGPPPKLLDFASDPIYPAIQPFCVHLRAWLKRAYPYVNVDFDGSDLVLAMLALSDIKIPRDECDCTWQHRQAVHAKKLCFNDLKRFFGADGGKLPDFFKHSFDDWYNGAIYFFLKKVS
jgi:hypothetical protein